MADETWFDWWQRNGRDPGNVSIASQGQPKRVSKDEYGGIQPPTAESPDPQEIVVVGSILSGD